MSDTVMRRGKTHRQHMNGKWHRHLENQQKRREWNQAYMTSSKAGGLRVIPYPKIGF